MEKEKVFLEKLQNEIYYSQNKQNLTRHRINTIDNNANNPFKNILEENKIEPKFYSIISKKVIKAIILKVIPENIHEPLIIIGVMDQIIKCKQFKKIITKDKIIKKPIKNILKENKIKVLAISTILLKRIIYLLQMKNNKED